MNTLTNDCCAPAQTQPTEYAKPRVNIRQDGDSYTLEAELPGVGKDGVEVTVENGKLTLLGRRAEGTEPGTPVHRESRSRAYRRVFELDPAIDPESITASIEQGLLTVRFSKTEAVKPRKITVA